MITTDVENYPGFAQAIQGPFLMEQMQAQAEHVGTRVIHDLAMSVDFSARPFRVTGDSGTVYLADACVIATGAQARWLGLPSEARLRGAGVSACATCDGFFYRGKRVAVVGGGNTAVEEALFLTHHADKVTLIHRRGTLRAEKIMQRQTLRASQDRRSLEFGGRGGDRGGEAGGRPGLRIRDVGTGALTTLPVDGVFIAIGHMPNTSEFRGQIALDDEGYIITKPGQTTTSVAGVFAAGDVQDKHWRQAVTAAGTGCIAALEAERFLTLASAGAGLAAAAE